MAASKASMKINGVIEWRNISRKKESYNGNVA
jgi:hypothetical protein